MTVYKKIKGFTLIELLITISIIGFVATAGFYLLTSIRMQSRDTLRVGNIDNIKKALSLYLNDQSRFPTSAGECLYDNNTVGSAPYELKNKNSIVRTPSDPMWPQTIPNPRTADLHAATSTASNFCYYYWSDGVSFNLSYFLELTSTKTGAAGIHVVSYDR
jgi:prepilin-type N-terminal cleavage/methylation domain-containing protein